MVVSQLGLHLWPPSLDGTLSPGQKRGELGGPEINSDLFKVTVGADGQEGRAGAVGRSRGLGYWPGSVWKHIPPF